MKLKFGQVELYVNESLKDESLSVSLNYSTSGNKNVNEMRDFVNDCQNALSQAQYIESLIKREKLTMKGIKKRLNLAS